MAMAKRNRRRTDTPFDPAAGLGLIAAAGLIISAIVLGGSPGAFLDLPSALVVLGGTLAITVTSFPAADIGEVPKTIAMALSPRSAGSSRRVALEGLALAELARRENLLAIETNSAALSNRPILQRGVQMLVDGTRVERVRPAIEREIAAIEERKHRAEGVLRRAAEVAPAMGLVGTLIGLVQMLGRLDDPSSIGPAMAVALLTTFYGALLAYAVLTPLAERLGRMRETERLHNELQLVCIMSIAERENPRRLETLLNGLLPAHDQLAEMA